MSNDLSRRKFLEKLGVGAATGAGAWLLKDVAQAEPARISSWVPCCAMCDRRAMIHLRRVFAEKCEQRNAAEGLMVAR